MKASRVLALSAVPFFTLAAIAATQSALAAWTFPLLGVGLIYLAMAEATRR